MTVAELSLITMEFAYEFLVHGGGLERGELYNLTFSCHFRWNLSPLCHAL